ncbi:MAG: VCBS repeat-containing protein [Rhodobacteraceae bacterium]|nr:VCBS repeat-containing protein [Paracoccaceae bacterium]
MLAGTAQAQTISAVRLAEPTARYGHHPMGPGVADHGALEIMLDGGERRLIRLPQSRVFEDLTARLVDVTGDGQPEVVVIESDQTQGARVSVYGSNGVIAASPFIGQRHRWYAVSGIADLDGDGTVEIAVVDRPHLRKALVIWRREGDRLVAVATLAGVTNHLFGEARIQGGLRFCGSGAEVILARADWSGLVAVRLVDGALIARDLPGDADAEGFAQAMACGI